jgi:hypothetical protein
VLLRDAAEAGFVDEVSDVLRAGATRRQLVASCSLIRQHNTSGSAVEEDRRDLLSTGAVEQERGVCSSRSDSQGRTTASSQ